MSNSSGINGPAIFVAQYISDEAPFNTLEGIAEWAARLGYKGIQIPVDPRLIDIQRAADDLSYCSALLDTLKRYGIQLTELSTHLQGQLIAVHPAYDVLFDGFAPQDRPQSLVDKGFDELATRWKPILDAFDEAGVDLCYEIHPGEDLHDGVSFELFLKAVGGHKRACILYDPSHFILQQLDYLSFVDIYHERIKIFHVKDAEFVPNGRQGVYGGYGSWIERAGRFRALGDGQVQFKGIFTRLIQHGYCGWAVLESECAFKDKMVCAEEGAPFIANHIFPLAKTSFDDFAGSGVSDDQVSRILGIP
ncbi:xylose isomerase-like protein [Penicillium lagena]|uniref:xylose isomerase-like protein n=1 Tax=Penicillium lagena TaxID=94218 RepID=UPI00253FA654|nr:xylose isomerase-like protein [Penicillium lagena]KAJ5604439.1 xylose isomerase-like protein [Penicillium lagena]